MSKAKPTRPIITLSAGPVDAYPEVLRALSSPVTYDFDPYFQQFFEDLTRKTARAMATERMPLILQGEPVLGLEAAAASLIALAMLIGTDFNIGGIKGIGPKNALKLVIKYNAKSFAFWLFKLYLSTISLYKISSKYCSKTFNLYS